MIAYVTSIGETTTALCKWSLERNGFNVFVLQDKATLAEKLERIYKGNLRGDFVRIDADVIVNKNFTPEFLESLDKVIWWWQFRFFDWYRQDMGHGMSFIREEALPALRENVDKFMKYIRPETELSRIKEFYNPRRFETCETVMGIHGYGIKNVNYVRALKTARDQLDNYDFELCERLNLL